MNHIDDTLRRWQWPFRQVVNTALFAIACYGVLLGTKRGQLDLVIFAIGVLLSATTALNLAIGEVQIGQKRTVSKQENSQSYWLRTGIFAFIGVGFILISLLIRFFPNGL